MTLAYRGVDQIAEARFVAIRENRAAEVGRLAPLVRIIAKRRGRMVGGVVGVTFGLLAFVTALVSYDASGRWLDGRGSGLGTLFLLSAWPLAAVASGIASMQCRLKTARRALAPLRKTGDALVDLARVEQLDPARTLASFAKGQERLSVALPLAGIAMLAPLTLHFAVALFLSSSSNASTETAADFDGWIRWSVLLVGHAHLVLVYLGFRFARRLGARSSAEIEQKGTARDGFGAIALTTVASLVPGAVVFLVPPTLVFVTGAVFAPIAYAVMGRRVLAERRVIEQLEGPLEGVTSKA